MRKNSHQKWDRATISTGDSASAIVCGVKKKRIVRRSCPSATPTRMELSQSWAEQLTFEERSGWDGETLLLPFSFPSSFSLFPFPFHSLSLSLALTVSDFLVGQTFHSIDIYSWVVYTKRACLCVYICVCACVCMLVCSHLDGTPPIHHARRLGRELNCPGDGVFPSLSISISVLFVKTFRLLGCIALRLDVTLCKLEELIRMRGWLQLLFIRSR